MPPVKKSVSKRGKAAPAGEKPFNKQKDLVNKDTRKWNHNAPSSVEEVEERIRQQLIKEMEDGESKRGNVLQLWLARKAEEEAERAKFFPSRPGVMDFSKLTAEEQSAMVAELTGYGLRLIDIARIIGATEDEVKQKFEEEIWMGQASAYGMVARTAFMMANSGLHPGLTIFWLKTRMGWKEPKDDDPSDENAPPPTRVEVIVKDARVEAKVSKKEKD